MKFPLYFDYQATTPTDPAVLEAMLPWFHERFGNPHARYHAYGWRAEEGTEQAREQVARLIGAQAKEVIFTSGATEANNLAIKGIAEAYAGAEGRKHHFITSAIEHKCVLECMRWLETQGHRISIIPVDKAGIIDMQALEAAICEDTLLVSVMAVNNEIGTLQPIEEIGALCRSKEVFYHCDAAQAFGRIALDVNAMNIDLLSLSSHKIYGPPGVGALYIRRRPKVRIAPQSLGGGQERGMRSGTLPTPLIVGLGKAAEVARLSMQEEHVRLQGFYEQFLAATVDVYDDITLNGHRQKRYPGNLNLSFAGVEGESMIMALKKLAVSSGSACASGSAEPSYVLQAIGVPRDVAHASIRFGLGRFTTQEEVEFATKTVIEAYRQLKSQSK